MKLKLKVKKLLIRNPKKVKSKNRQKKSSDSIEHKLKNASDAMNADEEKGEIEREVDFPKKGGHHGQRDQKED